MIGFGTSPLELLASAAMLKGLVYLDEFTYSAAWITGTPTALGANATQAVQIQINSDSDFIAQEYNLTAWTAAETQYAARDFLISLTRSGAGRELFSQAQPVNNICGNYSIGSTNLPGKNPISSLYQGNGTVTVTLQSRSASAMNRVDFTMRGFKVFYQTNAAGVTGNRQDIFHAL